MEDLRFRPERQDTSPNDVALVRLAWFVGLALLLALVGPRPLFAATFSALLGLAALALSLAAALLREPVWQQHLTRWDVAAVLYLLSVLFGWAVDPEAVRGFLAEQASSG